MTPARQQNGKTVRAVAFHEAGHAVAHLQAGFTVYTVSIVETDNQLGACTSLSEWDVIDPDDARQTKRDLTALAVAALAGPWAEHQYTREPVARDTSDYEKAATIATTHRLRISLPTLERKARNLVAKHWTLIEQIANALIERRHLDKSQIEAFAEQQVRHDPTTTQSR